MINYPKFKSEQVNFIFDQGGLGDNIARLPALSYIKERHPHLIPLVYIPDYFYDLAKNVLPDVQFFKISEGEKLYNEKLPGRTTGARWFTNLKTRMDLHAFALIANEIPDDPKVLSYLPINTNPVAINKFNLPKKYIIFTVNYTAPIREWPAKICNEVINYVVSKGYKVIFLGKKETFTGTEHKIVGNISEEIDFSKGINLIDKTNLLEAAKIMSKAELILGVDNGLLHLASCTPVKVLSAYTSVDPKHRIPYRYGEYSKNYWTLEPPDSEPEKFAQSIWDFTFQHDFKFSLYGNNNLVNSITSEMWINKIKEILGE